MYEKFFGFQKRPFDLVPDPDFLFLGESHDTAMANLLLGIQSEKGFIVITGGVGTGKTTILRAVLRRLGRELDVAFLNQPDLDASELLRTILHEFDFPAQSEDKVVLRGQLRAFLEQRDKPTILVIDEAHILDEEALEQVRLLSNFEMNNRKLLQIVLAGQPELKQLLSRPRLRPLAQRIEMFYEIQPLSVLESMAYIQRRIQIAGNPDGLVFEPRAMEAIYERTGGVPRLINLLADRTLITAYVAEEKTITARMVREAYEDLGEVTQQVMLSPEPISKTPAPKSQEALVFEPEPERHPAFEEPRKRRPLRRIERWIAGLGIGCIAVVAMLSFGWDGAFGSRSGHSKSSVSAQETAPGSADPAKSAAKEKSAEKASAEKTSSSKRSGGESGSSKTPAVASATDKGPSANTPNSLPKSEPKQNAAPRSVIEERATFEREETLKREEERRVRELQAERDAAVAAIARDTAPAKNVRYAIQCGSFRELEQAEELSQRLTAALGKPPRISSVEMSAGPVHRVLVGMYATRQEALEELGPLRRSNAGMILQILEIPIEESHAAPSTPSNE